MLDFKKGFSLQFKVLALMSIPIAAFLWASMQTIMDSYALTQESKMAEQNARIMSLTSKTLKETQTERGQNGLFMAGKLPREDLQKQREENDKMTKELLTAIEGSKLNSEHLAKIRQAATQIVELRSKIDASQITDIDAMRGYSGAISNYLKSQAMMASYMKLLASGAVRLQSISLIEDARENSGAIRPLITNILANDKAIDSATLARVVQIFNSIGPVLLLPGLDISDAGRKSVGEIINSSDWKEVDRIVDIVIKKSATGAYKENPVSWFAAGTAVYTRVSNMLDSEIAGVAAWAEAQDASAKAIMRNQAILLSVLTFGTLFFVLYFLRKSVIGPIQKVLNQLSMVTQETRSSSLKLSASAQRSAAAAAEEAAAIQETGSAMAEMTSMLGQTSTHTRVASSAAQQALERTQDGARTMGNMATSMDSIASANARLKDITRIIEDIASRTNVINDIVFKTQLLAVNASIEAARAGHHGKGFAVVANEVGNLASMSGKAAAEIRQLLAESKSQVSVIVEHTAESVQTGQNVSRDAVSTFEDISGAISNINSTVQQIFDATREQEVGVRQTSQAMDELNRATTDNNALARENAGLSAHIKGQGDRLERIERAMNFVVLGHERGTNNFGREVKKLSGVDEILIGSTNMSQNGKQDFANDDQSHGDASSANGSLASDVDEYRAANPNQQSTTTKGDLVERILRKSTSGGAPTEQNRNSKIASIESIRKSTESGSAEELHHGATGSDGQR